MLRKFFIIACLTSGAVPAWAVALTGRGEMTDAILFFIAVAVVMILWQFSVLCGALIEACEIVKGEDFRPTRR